MENENFHQPIETMGLDFEVVEFVVTIVMTVMFGLVIVMGIVYFLRTCITGSSTNAKQNFYMTILVFALCRVTYFAFKIYFFATKRPNEYVQRFSMSIYHLGSTFFYTAFLFLIIYWGEIKISSGVMSEDAASKSIRIFKIVYYVVIAIVNLLQVGMFIARMMVKIPPTGSPEADIVDIVQLFYHGFLCFVIVLLFILFTVYSIRQEWVGFKPTEDKQSSARKITVITIILSILILIKGFMNLTLAILEILSFVSVTHFAATIIYSISALLFDLGPTLIVVFTISTIKERPKKQGLLKLQKV